MQCVSQYPVYFCSRSLHYSPPYVFSSFYYIFLCSSYLGGKLADMWSNRSTAALLLSTTSTASSSSTTSSTPIISTNQASPPLKDVAPYLLVPTIGCFAMTPFLAATVLIPNLYGAMASLFVGMSCWFLVFLLSA